MPGKKKKERKPPPGARKGKNKAAPGPKGRPQYGAQQETMRSTGHKHQGGHASKTFTLVDEALGSTRLGSKRLWKGAAATSKLRHLPVVFIRAAEAYDPSKVLRDQIAAAVLAEPKVAAEDMTMDATEVSVLDDVLPKDGYSELEQELLSTLHGDVPAETSTPVERPVREVQPTETTATDAVAAATSSAAIEEHIKTPSLSDVPEAQAASDRPRLSSSAPVDLDALLESMGVVDTELEPQVQSQPPNEAMAKPTSESEEDEDDSDDSDMDEDSDLSGSSEEILEEEEVSFYVDTEGDTTLASLDMQSTSARPLTLTAASTPARVATSGDSTPWARTIDDPVATEESMPTTSQTASLGNVFEQSGGSGKRGGRRKRERQEAVQEQLRMDEAYAIHLDYMEHSRWRDAGDSDDAQEIEDEEDDGDTPLLARMLAGLGPANSFGNTEPMHDSELDDEDDEDAEEEDASMDDDALEAFLDAESQLVDFGRSGRKASRRAYNDYSADALFHDDFNVYDYNSAGEDDLESLPDLPASGARRRDLNQFVQDLDLSDEELELELIAQWKADKASKKSRKRERQQQHAEGLLGKRAKRARAAHAQNGGETLGEYHNIIKRFVSHADYVGVAQLPLPAMDRSIRRAVHIIAQHGYQLQTKSQGSGKRRYPVLYKTQHTCTAERLPDALFMEEIMAQAQKTVGYTSSIKHRSALQPGGKVKGKGKGATGGGGGGIGKSAGGGAGKLRDGEIVGEHAPEIGLSNRGRAMLEKLGWSRGTGLGVAGNVGISVPIMATVKNSRVGLGT